jgi:hypothetical protein
MMAMIRIVEGGADESPLASIALLVLALAALTVVYRWMLHHRTFSHR